MIHAGTRAASCAHLPAALGATHAMQSGTAAPGWKLHPLHGRLADHWAVWVSGNWRLTFTFENGDAILVDYQDYHQGKHHGHHAQPPTPRRSAARMAD
ncbi:MAG: type II toxin-antitoxin system RelE/ParE family toxin [Dokdonella sp.]|nr:type II toxin-antitoxin system RelE/ParE family toxin [Dokdonella sp.]MBX3689412.1 type II toxin-antitoxin system RelE/ParE family toxin [Dokdonella sp.]